MFKKNEELFFIASSLFVLSVTYKWIESDVIFTINTFIFFLILLLSTLSIKKFAGYFIKKYSNKTQKEVLNSIFPALMCFFLGSILIISFSVLIGNFIGFLWNDINLNELLPHFLNNEFLPAVVFLSLLLMFGSIVFFYFL